MQALFVSFEMVNSDRFTLLRDLVNLEIASDGAFGKFISLSIGAKI